MGCFLLLLCSLLLLTDARSHVNHEVDNRDDLDIHPMSQVGISLHRLTFNRCRLFARQFLHFKKVNSRSW